MSKNAGCSLKKEKYLAIPLTTENEQVIQRLLNITPFIGLPARTARSTLENTKLCKQTKDIQKDFEKEMKQRLETVTDLNILADWVSCRMDKDLETTKNNITIRQRLFENLKRRLFRFQKEKCF